VTTMLPSRWIDWETTIAQYKNKKFAASLIHLFADELPKLQLRMKKHYANNRLQALTRTVHQIHGACCFCAAPKLESYSATLQHQLENKNYSQLKQQVNELDAIINRVLAAMRPYLNSLDIKKKEN
jgi:two-component system sensor histidine kinase BarA